MCTTGIHGPAIDPLHTWRELWVTQDPGLKQLVVWTPMTQVRLLGPDTDAGCNGTFSLSLLRETCLLLCQGQSQVPREKALSSSHGRRERGTEFKLPFFHLLTCLMCQPGTRFTELTRQSRCSKGPSSLLGDPDL